MRGFKDIGSRGHFSAKKGVWVKRELYSEIRLEHFLDSSRCSFVQKLSKSDAQFSRYGVTDKRTNEREPIGLSG